MAEHELESLLGGFAADTLTAEEKQQLFQAALHDQELFNALADEQALKELLADPVVRRRLLQSLRAIRSTTAGSSASWLDWFGRPAGLAWAGGLVAAVLAVFLGTRVYQESIKQAARSVVTEEAKRSPSPSSAPAAPQPTTPPDNEPQLQGTEAEKSPLAAPKKDSFVSKRSRQDSTVPTQPEELRTREPARPRSSQQSGRTALQRQGEPSIDKLTESKEVDTASVDHTRAATLPPQASASAPATISPPAGAAMSGQAASSLSARELFYRESPESAGFRAKEKEQPPAPLTQLDQRSGQLEPGRAPLRADQSLRAAPSLPLAIRYSVMGSGEDVKHREADGEGVNHTGAIGLTIESNQNGHLQIWSNVRSSQPRLLFPARQEPPKSWQVSARQRLSITIPGGQTMIILRFSRLPDSSIPDFSLIDRPPTDQLQESSMADGEHTTYVANRDASRPELLTHIPMTKP